MGSSRRAGRISAAPERGEAPLDVDGVLTRTVGDTAAILDVLAGYELGDVTWAPPPSEPFAASVAREPGKLRIAATTFPPLADAVVDPVCAQAVTDAAELLRSLGHEVEEVDPPWRIEGLSELFGAVFSIHIALQIVYSGMVAGREPTAEDMEPMSWAIHQMTQNINSVLGLRHGNPIAGTHAPTGRVPGSLRRSAHARLGRAAAADRHARHRRARSHVDVHPLGLFTPFTPVFNASGQPGISLPLYQGEDGLPLGVQLVGRPAGRRRCWRWPRRSRRPRRGRHAGRLCPSIAKDRLHRLGGHAQGLGVGDSVLGHHVGLQ